MKVVFRPPELRLEQALVSEAEGKLCKAFPDSVYRSKLRKFPRALAGEAVEYKSILEKCTMKQAADSHDAARIAVFRRVQSILNAEEDRQALLWKELLDELTAQRQCIVKSIRNKRRRQRKLLPSHLVRELEQIEEQIHLIQCYSYESGNM